MERKRRFVWLSLVLLLLYKVCFLWFAALSCHSFFCLFISGRKSLLACFLFSCHYLSNIYIHNLINELLIIVSYFSYLKKKIKTPSDKTSLKKRLNDLKYYTLRIYLLVVKMNNNNNSSSYVPIKKHYKSS